MDSMDVLDKNENSVGLVAVQFSGLNIQTLEVPSFISGAIEVWNEMYMHMNKDNINYLIYINYLMQLII